MRAAKIILCILSIPVVGAVPRCGSPMIRKRCTKVISPKTAPLKQCIRNERIPRLRNLTSYAANRDRDDLRVSHL